MGMLTKNFWDNNRKQIKFLDDVLGYRAQGDPTGRHCNIGMVKAHLHFQEAYEDARQILWDFEREKVKLWNNLQGQLAILAKPILRPKLSMPTQDNTGQLARLEQTHAHKNQEKAQRLQDKFEQK